MSAQPHLAYIGLGANLGHPQQTIQAAVATLRSLASITVTKTSSAYLTAPMEAEGGDYVNAVVEICTQLSPTELLTELQALEQRYGRVRTYQNAPRTLDCDLLLYDRLVIDTLTLQVPHPRMHQRAFVLVPLVEIAPDIVIPNRGSAGELLLRVSDQPIRKFVDLL